VSPINEDLNIQFTPGICIGYSTIETKEAVRIEYNGFLFPHEYSGKHKVVTWVRMRKMKPVISNDSFHLKDVEIFKYKRESKGCWPIQNCRFIFVNCWSVLNITDFFFRTSTQVNTRPSHEYECGKWNLLYPIRAASFATNCKELLTFK
jgi:hypothetical protein